MRRQHAFSLIELMVAIAVIGVILALALPSFTDYLLVQRAKSINAQAVTDVNLARSEAVSRNVISRIVFADDTSMTCYTVFTNPTGAPTAQRCNCLLGPGAACSGTTAAEIRTVQVPRSTGVTVTAPGNVISGTNPTPAVGFNNVTGGLLGIPIDQGAAVIPQFNVETAISSTRLLRTVLSKTGRPVVCSVGDNLGATSC